MIGDPSTVSLLGYRASAASIQSQPGVSWACEYHSGTNIPRLEPHDLLDKAAPQQTLYKQQPIRHVDLALKTEGITSLRGISPSLLNMHSQAVPGRTFYISPSKQNFGAYGCPIISTPLCYRIAKPGYVSKGSLALLAGRILDVLRCALQLLTYQRLTGANSQLPC
jgi:hypothetical protein